MNISFKESHPKNFKVGRISAIEFIVLHYTANDGDTAKNNADYFARESAGASAHYFVDESSTIWQSVKDEDTAWHCGTTGPYKHPVCRNDNSLGIEMCSRKDSNSIFYVKQNTADNASDLTKMLMDKYNIPIENILRHYDVTSKQCPEPFVRITELWSAFKSRLVPDKRPKILIDPGHGGSDHGASGYMLLFENANYTFKQFYEKELTLKIASKLKKQFEIQLEEVAAFLSREDDINLSDQDRIRLADAYDVDAIISLHFASYPPNSGYGGWGVETFYAKSSQRDRNFAQSLHNSLTTNFTCKNRGVKNSTQSQNDALDILTIGTGDYLRSVISLDFPDSPKSFNINDSDSLQYVFGYNWDKQVIDFSYATISGCGIPIERM